jgi:hypothetical protein
MLVDRVIPFQKTLLDEHRDQRAGVRLGDGGDPTGRLDRERGLALEIGHSKGLAKNHFSTVHDQHGSAGHEAAIDSILHDASNAIALGVRSPVFDPGLLGLGIS